MPSPRLLPIALLLLLVPRGGDGQQRELRQEIIESQRRLEEIRAERLRLEENIENVRIRVRDVASELRNVEQRLSVSRSALEEIQFQSDATTEEIEENTRQLLHTRERIAEGRAVLNRRLRDIYKMGSLHTVRVLLGASSFTNLLNRYRYLQRIASFDQALIARIQSDEADLVRQDATLQSRMSELDRLRRERVAELTQLRAVESERQTMLREFRSQERRTASRLEQLEGDESRMTDLISDLEVRRRELERRTAARGNVAPSISPEDAGSLDWPVDGELLYDFGPERQRNGTVLRWNGVGIAAPTGTPVRAVKAGRVAMAGPFEGYGPTVVLDHGDGFYTLYLYLEEIGVVQGRDVEPGQVVGPVGGGETPEGPHLEFQIRAPNAGGSPQVQDPLLWLKPKEGG
ncbi:MAG: peptidoglycan DD-metalloendopeptidase family protein [Gemmatimonadota bacterium]|nr:peptidoglycan DD-metalloendopeptidase family protein [Gemmatimonadota bacterium]